MSKKSLNSKPTNGGKKITQTRNPRQRSGQPNMPQRKVARVERAPVAIGNKTFQSKPRYRNMGEDLCVSHSEYIGDITGSSSPFVVALAIALNPGLASSFPWLAQIASRYESYKFLKLHFRFMTERPTTESGYIAIVPDYDPTDPQPATKANAFQYEGTSKCAPWENLTQISTPKNLSKRKTYGVRQGPINPNENLGLYDTANFFICVGGNTGAVNLGELWCDYEVCLQTPQIDSNVGSVDALLLTSIGSTTTALPLGVNPVAQFSRASFATYNNANGALTFTAPFRGLAVYEVSGGTLTIGGSTGSTVTLLAIDTDTTDGTDMVVRVLFSAEIGQVLDFIVGGASVSSTVLRLAPWPTPLL